jgi:hypothetical protein
MEKAPKPLDISNLPELLRIAQEVRDTNEPRLLRREREDLAILTPAKGARRRPPVPRGKPTSAADPLWSIVGIGRSTGPTDVSSHKHKYLAEAYAAEAR